MRDGPSRARRPGGCDETPCLFGLAPCGVYRAATVTSRAVGSYPTFSPLPPFARGRFVFCCTGRPDALKHPSRTLSGTLPCGVRTFLPLPTPRGAEGSDRPAACTYGKCTAVGPSATITHCVILSGVWRFSPNGVEGPRRRSSCPIPSKPSSTTNDVSSF